MMARVGHGGLATTGTVNLAGSTLACPCHVCALYRSPEEQYAALVPFVKEGIEAGDRVISFVDPAEREERLNRLRHAGIDTEAAQRDGRLEIGTWDQYYLGVDGFDPDDMLTLVQEMIDRSHKLGFERIRCWANMEWALLDVPGAEKLAVYESRLNYILPLYGEAIVCAYDVTRFSASVLEDVVRAHPHLSADGWAASQPHYVPPEQLIPELENKLA